MNVYMDAAPFHKDPEELLDLKFDGAIMTKFVSTKCPYDESIELLDLKLNTMGVFEDEWYSTLPELIKNVRRGNTIIKKTD